MVFITAEIGINHNGDINVAKKLIDLAVRTGCDAVKFQKRDNKKLLSNEEYLAPHPNLKNSYGNTYGLHREYLEFDMDQHKM